MSDWLPRSSGGGGDQSQTRMSGGRVPPPPPLISEKRRYESPEVTVLRDSSTRRGEEMWNPQQKHASPDLGSKRSMSPPRGVPYSGRRSPFDSHPPFKRTSENAPAGSNQPYSGTFNRSPKSFPHDSWSGHTRSPPISKESHNLGKFRETSPFRTPESFVMSQDYKFQRSSNAKEEFRGPSFAEEFSRDSGPHFPIPGTRKEFELSKSLSNQTDNRQAKGLENYSREQRLEKDLEYQPRSFGRSSPTRDFRGNLRSTSPSESKTSEHQKFSREDSKPTAKDIGFRNSKSPPYPDQALQRSRSFQLQNDSHALMSEQHRNMRPSAERIRPYGSPTNAQSLTSKDVDPYQAKKTELEFRGSQNRNRSRSPREFSRERSFRKSRSRSFSPQRPRDERGAPKVEKPKLRSFEPEPLEATKRSRSPMQRIASHPKEIPRKRDQKSPSFERSPPRQVRSSGSPKRFKKSRSRSKSRSMEKITGSGSRKDFDRGRQRERSMSPRSKRSFERPGGSSPRSRRRTRERSESNERPRRRDRSRSRSGSFERGSRARERSRSYERVKRRKRTRSRSRSRSPRPRYSDNRKSRSPRNNRETRPSIPKDRERYQDRRSPEIITLSSPEKSKSIESQKISSRFSTQNQLSHHGIPNLQTKAQTFEKFQTPELFSGSGPSRLENPKLGEVKLDSFQPGRLASSMTGIRDIAPFQQKLNSENLPNPYVARPISNYSFENHNKRVLLSGIVTELINSRTGSLEVKEIEQQALSEPATVFFHIAFLWVSNPNGNPFGPPVQFTSLLTDGVSLKSCYPIGSRVNLYAIPVKSPFFQLGAICVWPTSTEKPPMPDSREESRIGIFIEEFNKNSCLVQASVTQFPYKDDPSSKAIVWQIKDNNYGIIEVTGGYHAEPYRFFCLFHKDQVWLKDGQRAVDLPFFSNSPIESFLQQDQKVQIIARSIVDSSGFSLKSSILELQAIIVYVGSDIELPSTIPRPHKCKIGTGTFHKDETTSWYFFDQAYQMALNKNLLMYLEKFQKKYPKLNPTCLTLDLSISKLTPKMLLAQNPTPEDKYTEQSFSSNTGLTETPLSGSGPLEYRMPTGDPLPKLDRFEGYIVSHVSQDYFILKGMDQSYVTWHCLVSRYVIFTKEPFRGIQSSYPLNLRLIVNAVLLDESASIQYVAMVGWDPERVAISKDEAEHRQRPLSLQTVKMYHSSCKLIKSEIFRAKEGFIVDIIDKNYGVACCDQELIIFDSCDVWVNTNATLNQMQHSLTSFFKIGDQIVVNATCIEDNAEISYLATAIWPKTSNEAFNTAMRGLKTLVRHQISKGKLDNFKVVADALRSKNMKSRIIQSSNSEQKDEALLNTIGKIIGYLESESGFLVESMEKSWRCVVPSKLVKTKNPVIGHLARHFEIDSTVMLDMILMAKDRPAQYLALAAWKPEEDNLFSKNKSPELSVDDQSIEFYHRCSRRSTLSFDEKVPPSLRGKLITKYSNSRGVVVKIIDGKMGIIEAEKHGNKVFFDVTDILRSKKISKKLSHAKFELMKDVSEMERPNAIIPYKVGNRVAFHAVLVDGSTMIPYIASDVWEKGGNVSKVPMASEISDFKMKLYKDYVDQEHRASNIEPHFEKTAPFLDPLPITPVPPIPSNPTLMTGAPIQTMGTGLIPSKGNPTGWYPPPGMLPGWVSPFGISSSWIPPTSGIPQLPLKFPILSIPNAQTGLLNQIMQQNLATNSSIISKGPILNQAAANLQQAAPPTGSQSQSRFMKEVKLGQLGTVISLFRETLPSKTDDYFGGLIRIIDSRKVCFFLASCCSKKFNLNDLVQADLHPFKLFDRQQNPKHLEVHYVALSVTQPNGTQSLPESRLITNSVMSSARMALIYRNKQNDLTADKIVGNVVELVVSSSNPSSGPKSGPATFDHLEAMINEDCGVMKCRKTNQEGLVACYFELKVIRVPSLKELRELVTLIDSSSGISVSCDLAVSSDSAVPYVVTRFRISGELPPHLCHLDNQPARNPLEEPDSEKEARFRRLIQLYKVGCVAWKNTPSSAKIPTRKPEVPDDNIVLGKGVVKLILNENFALIFGPSHLPVRERKFCLFDVCDLYISNEKTASDVGKIISEETPIDTIVEYNACKMDDFGCIPYLATSVWKYDGIGTRPSLPWLPKSSIKPEKVQIYNQVSQSSRSIVLATKEQMMK